MRLPGRRLPTGAYNKRPNTCAAPIKPAIHAAKGAELYALGTSSPEKAAGFQDFAPGLKVHNSYDALLRSLVSATPSGHTL